MQLFSKQVCSSSLTTQWCQPSQAFVLQNFVIVSEPCPLITLILYHKTIELSIVKITKIKKVFLIVFVHFDGRPGGVRRQGKEVDYSTSISASKMAIHIFSENYPSLVDYLSVRAAINDIYKNIFYGFTKTNLLF